MKPLSVLVGSANGPVPLTVEKEEEIIDLKIVGLDFTQAFHPLFPPAFERLIWVTGIEVHCKGCTNAKRS